MSDSAQMWHTPEQGRLFAILGPSHHRRLAQRAVVSGLFLARSPLVKGYQLHLAGSTFEIIAPPLALCHYERWVGGIKLSGQSSSASVADG